jgi:hypothetical protein
MVIFVVMVSINTNSLSVFGLKINENITQCINSIIESYYESELNILNFSENPEFNDRIISIKNNVEIHYNIDKLSTNKPDFENGKTWYVDDEPGEGPNNPPEDFIRIHDAINASRIGDTIYVYSGIYFENVIIDRPIILQGENRNTTIINGGGNGSVVSIFHDFVVISSFTIINSGRNGWDWGICQYASHCIVVDCIISSFNSHGYGIEKGSNNIIQRCDISTNARQGIL